MEIFTIPYHLQSKNMIELFDIIAKDKETDVLRWYSRYQLEILYESYISLDRAIHNCSFPHDVACYSRFRDIIKNNILYIQSVISVRHENIFDLEDVKSEVKDNTPQFGHEVHCTMWKKKGTSKFVKVFSSFGVSPVYVVCKEVSKDITPAEIDTMGNTFTIKSEIFYDEYEPLCESHIRDMYSSANQLFKNGIIDKKEHLKLISKIYSKTSNLHMHIISCKPYKHKHRIQGNAFTFDK